MVFLQTATNFVQQRLIPSTKSIKIQSDFNTKIDIIFKNLNDVYSTYFGGKLYN